MQNKAVTSHCAHERLLRSFLDLVCEQFAVGTRITRAIRRARVRSHH